MKAVGQRSRSSADDRSAGAVIDDPEALDAAACAAFLTSQ